MGPVVYFCSSRSCLESLKYFYQAILGQKINETILNSQKTLGNFQNNTTNFETKPNNALLYVFFWGSIGARLNIQKWVPLVLVSF